MKATDLAIAVVLVGVALSVSGSRALTLKLSAQIAMQPATIDAVVRVERNADSRRVVVEVDGDDYFSADERQVDGDQEQLSVYRFTFKRIPAGTYRVVATLFASGQQQIANAVQNLEVH